MRIRSLAALVALAFGTTACYHAVVDTGRAPGTTTIEKPWTATYVFGLVGAAEIQTASQCPAGVAVVETQQSFANGLVGMLTLGLYTPQTVTITCAAGAAGRTAAAEIRAAGSSLEQRTAAVDAAIARAAALDAPVAVRF